MSAWRGLANPERHRVTSIPDMAYCVVCVAGDPTGPGTAWPETDWQGLANAASAWLIATAIAYVLMGKDDDE